MQQASPHSPDFHMHAAIASLKFKEVAESTYVQWRLYCRY